MEAGQEPVLLARGVAQPAQDGEDLVGVDDQAGLAVLVVGAEDAARVGVAQLAGDQLEARARQASGRTLRRSRPRSDASRARAYAASAASEGWPAITSSRAHSSVPIAL